MDIYNLVGFVEMATVASKVQVFYGFDLKEQFHTIAALVAATLPCLMTSCIAGIFFPGDKASNLETDYVLNKLKGLQGNYGR